MRHQAEGRSRAAASLSLLRRPYSNALGMGVLTLRRQQLWRRRTPPVPLPQVFVEFRRRRFGAARPRPSQERSQSRCRSCKRSEQPLGAPVAGPSETPLFTRAAASVSSTP